MSDVTLIDTRGRAAGAALRDAAARRPMVSYTSAEVASTVDGRQRRPSRLRPALIAAFVVLLIAALVALTTRDPQPAQPSGPKDLRYIVTGLDQFWTAEGARDGGGVETDDSRGRFGTLYGTLGDPSRPGLLLTWVDASAPNTKPFNDQRFGVLIGASNVEDFQVNGFPAGCGDRPTGETQCRVETAQGFVAATAVGLSHTELQAILSTVQHDGKAVTIDAVSLPPSLSEVVSGPFDTVIGFDDVFSVAASAVRWTNSDGSVGTITVMHDDGTRLTRRAIQTGWRPVQIGDVSGFQREVSADAATVMWMRDGKVFSAEVTRGSNQSVSALDLALQFATSLRRATDAEWDELPAWRDDVTDPGAEVSAPSITESTTTTSSSSSTDPQGDVVLGLDSLSKGGGEFTVRSTGAGAADDQVTVGLALDTFQIIANVSINLRKVPASPTLDLVGLDSARGVYVLSPVDGELVVTGQDGTRYHATPEDLFDRADARFTMIVLPVNFANAQFVAPDGSVLAELAGNL